MKEMVAEYGGETKKGKIHPPQAARGVELKIYTFASAQGGAVIGWGISNPTWMR